MTGRRRWPIAVFGVLAVVLAVVGAVLVVRLDRAQDRAGEGTRSEVVRAASEGAAALLTYTPDTVAADMYAATARLTGDFRDYYGRLTDTVIVPTAREQGISRSASVTESGVTTVHGDSAEALVFLRQVTRTTAAPDPVTERVGARVELTRVDGRWLISGLQVT